MDRNADGNEVDFDLNAQGVDGSDYHTMPADGTRFVQVPNGNGGSRRVVIGQDPFVPVINSLKCQLQGNQDDHQQATLQDAQAQNGVAGAPGLGSTPLATLKAQHTALSAQVTPAKNFLAQADAFIQSGGSLAPADAARFDAATATVNQSGDQLAPLESEIASRQSAIDAARQQRDSVNADSAATTKAIATLTSAKSGSSSTLQDDLVAALRGENVPAARTALYQRAGILNPVQGQDGTSSGYTVGAQGLAMLPKDAQTIVANDPDRFQLGDDAKAQIVAKQAAAVPQTQDATQADPQTACQTWQAQQNVLLNEFPNVGQSGSTANQTFIRAFQQVGNDPRKALDVARALFAGNK